MRTLAVLFLLALTPVLATSADNAAPVGFGMWSPAHIKEVGDRLEMKLGEKKMVYETLGTYKGHGTCKGHSIYLVLRGKTAAAEFHETEEDIQIGVRGTATFVIGGKLINPVKMPRKQQQGPGINGGAKFQVGPGDIVHVPVAVPHQLVIEPNKPYMYILIKLDEEPRNDVHN